MLSTRKTLLGAIFLLVAACATRTPFESLKKEYDRYPEYSIILEDMKEEGNFFKDYFHKYKVVYGRSEGQPDSLVYNSELTDWLEVKEKDYKNYYNYLGMVIFSKSRDGKVSDQKYPPGYQYVGDQRYGRWRTDNSGNSFWEWYGKFALMSHMFGMFNRPIYRNDYDMYRDYRRRGEPFFGRKHEYGTNGTRAKTTNPTFFERQRIKQAAAKTKFSQKVKNRVRRSKMSGVRRRSRGFGK